jgi:sn-glycerol 3-phosphate transport system substrate-binding protein
MKKIFRLIFALIFLLLGFAESHGEEIIFWHSFTGPLESSLQEVILKFNEKSQIKVKAVHMGHYSNLPDIALSQDIHGPHIIQVAEYQYDRLAATHAQAFLPIDQILPLHLDSLTPYARAFYERNGKLYGLPFNISAGVMFINWDQWLKAGLSQKDVPQTWAQMEHVLERLQKSKLGGFSTAWPVAYLFESFAAQIGTPLIINGAFQINIPTFVHRLEQFVELSKKGVYRYGGRFSDAEALFTSGDVVIFLQGANRLETLRSNRTVRAFPLPFDNKLVTRPYALNIGGASIWVKAGLSESQVSGIRLFMEYLLEPKVQADWFLKTHYLPLTNDALQKVMKLPSTPTTSGYPAILQVSAPRAAASNGVQHPLFYQIRTVIIQAIEEALSGQSTAQEALDKAQEKIQEKLSQFPG